MASRKELLQRRSDLEAKLNNRKQQLEMDFHGYKRHLGAEIAHPLNLASAFGLGFLANPFGIGSANDEHSSKQSSGHLVS